MGTWKHLGVAVALLVAQAAGAQTLSITHLPDPGVQSPTTMNSNYDAIVTNANAHNTRITAIENLVGTDSALTFPNGTNPTTNAVAECAFDTDALGANRGVVRCFDGTANTNLVGILTSDTCTNGQIPVFNTGGTWTCEDAASASGDITDVWACTSGNCNALTGASGDTFNAGSADSSIPWKVGTTATPTTEGQAVWDSDDNNLAVGDGAATKIIYPGPHALAASEGGAATTATALAANGSNCSAGSFPLGVDQSGAAESCTDAATQAELDALPAYTISASSPAATSCTTGAHWLNTTLGVSFNCIATNTWQSEPHTVCGAVYDRDYGAGAFNSTDQWTVMDLGAAVTIKRFSCHGENQDVQLIREDGAEADMFGTAAHCDADGDSKTSFSGSENAIGSSHYVDLKNVTASNMAKLGWCITYVYTP